MLYSKDSRFWLELTLLPISDRLHRGWHTYNLVVGVTETGAAADLSSEPDNPLFLNSDVDPEVPALCSGIRNAVDGDEEYSFTPMDEGDFFFSVRQDGGELIVTVDARDRPFGSDFGWPDGQCVTREALLKFAENLMREYKNLGERRNLDESG